MDCEGKIDYHYTRRLLTFNPGPPKAPYSYQLIDLILRSSHSTVTDESGLIRRILRHHVTIRRLDLTVLHVQHWLSPLPTHC